MRLVLDTNAVSALMKGDPRVVHRLRHVSKGEVSVPQPVLAEIAYGIERLPQSKRRKALQERFDLVRSELARLSWTDEISECFGTIKATLERKGRRIEDFDAAIAAHALATGAVLVTADLDDGVRSTLQRPGGRGGLLGRRQARSVVNGVLSFAAGSRDCATSRGGSQRRAASRERRCQSRMSRAVLGNPHDNGN